MRVIQHQLRGGLGVTIHVEPARGPAHVAELPRAVPEQHGADRGIVPAGLRVHRVRVPHQQHVQVAVAVVVSGQHAEDGSDLRL